MTHKQFAALVAEMRTAQNNYFPHWSKNVKILSLEAAVDAALVEMEKPCEHRNYDVIILGVAGEKKKFCHDCDKWVE